MRKWIIAGVAVVAVIAIVAGVALASGGKDTKKPVLITATAKVRDLQEEVSVAGVLERAEQRTINAVSAGTTQGGGPATVSAVRLKDGAALTAGQGILAVDGRESVVVDGALPFFRKLDVGAQGADVTELETVLAREGFAPGPIDQTFTEQTRFALAQWQAKHGFPGAAPSPGSAVSVALQQSQNYTLGPQSSAGLTIGPPAVKSAARTVRRGVGVASGPVLTITATSSTVARSSLAAFTITANAPSPSDITVSLSLGGTISTGDLLPGTSPATVTLPANATSVGVQYFVLPNATAPDQTLVVSIDDGTDYDVGAPAAATVEVPTSATPKVEISGTTSIDPGQSAVLTVTSTMPWDHDVQVNLSVGGTAQADSDYVAFPSYVIIPTGQTTATINVQAKTTTTIKPNRFLVVGLGQSANYTLGQLTAATVTILGESGTVQPTATITAGNLRVNGGSPAQFTIGFDRATSVATEIGLSFGGDAVPGSDFNPPGGVVTVPAGQTSITVNVPTLNNGIVQPDKTLVVSLLPGSGYTVGSPTSAQILILAPTLPKLNIVGSSGAVGLGGGAVFTVIADQAPVKDLSVQYTVTGTAQQGKDIQPVTGSVTLAAGQTTAVIPILTLNTNVFFLPTDMIAIAGPTRLGKVFVKEGDAVPVGTPLFSLTEPNIAVSMQVSAGDRTKLKLGQTGTAQVQDSSVSAPGVISKLDDFPTTDKESKKQYFAGTFQVQGTFDAADGTPVTVKVVTKQSKSALTIPIAAVKQNGEGQDVVRVIDLTRGGKTTDVPVKTGMTEGSYIEIVSGLKADDVVVVELNQNGTQ